MLSDNDPAAAAAQPRPAIAGGAIIVSAALAVAAVAHHPTLTHATSREDVLRQIVRLSGLDEAVHAIVIVAVCGLLYGLIAFAVRRGLRNDAVLAGLVAYALGTVFAIAAALIDGFVIPAIAARYAAAPRPSADLAPQLLALCAIAIQVATKTWLIATSFAVLAWSAGFLRQRGMLRLLGAGGIVVTAAMLVVLAFAGNVNTHSLGAVVLLQTLWYVAVGALMLRGEL